MSGIYIHIPFCKQACSYCDFYFVTRQKDRETFVQALIQEIKSHKNTPYTDEPVQTIYIGGGTPSLMAPSQLEEIFTALDDVFSLQTEEVTIELNPDDVTLDYLNALNRLGVTRASMGVQSFNPDLLRFMHRAHTSEHAFQCLDLLARSGFKSFTVDLIYGNPGQTPAMLTDDLETVLSFDPPHISAYSLTVEEGTRLGKQVELNRIKPLPEDDVADQFDLIREILAKAGLEQYEVSNFAKPGKQAVHNSAYWNHQNYLGFGPSAHSFWWNPSRTSAKRWSNEPNLTSFISGQKKKKVEFEKLSLKTLAEERLMLGLRTVKGVPVNELQKRYNYTFSDKQKTYLQKMQKKQKVELGDRIRLTSKGLPIADAITLDLLSLTN